MEQKLKKIRQERGLTREELSQKAGVPLLTLSLLESGNACVSTVGELSALAKALDRTVEEIFLP